LNICLNSRWFGSIKNQEKLHEIKCKKTLIGLVNEFTKQDMGRGGLNLIVWSVSNSIFKENDKKAHIRDVIIDILTDE